MIDLRWPWVALALACVGMQPIAAQAVPSRGLCRAGESNYFSCQVGAKLASLCGIIEQGKFAALIYGYGMADKATAMARWRFRASATK